MPIPEKTTEIPIDVIHNNSDLSTDSDSDNDVEDSSSDSYEEFENSDTDGHSLDSPDESETNGSQEKNIFCQRICLYGYSGLNFKTWYDNERLLKISLF